MLLRSTIIMPGGDGGNVHVTLESLTCRSHFLVAIIYVNDNCYVDCMFRWELSVPLPVIGFGKPFTIMGIVYCYLSFGGKSVIFRFLCQIGE